jgi:hypothetical protein
VNISLAVHNKLKERPCTSAENGSYLKLINGGWEKLVNDMDMGWKNQVMEVGFVAVL